MGILAFRALIKEDVCDAVRILETVFSTEEIT